MLYVAALIAGYFAVLVVLSVLARPHRVRLVMLANQLLADYPGNEFVEDLCRHFVESAYSLRVAPMRALQYAVFMFKPGHEIDRTCDRMHREQPEFFRDARIGAMIEAYNASTTAVSPLFGLLATVMRYAFLMKAYLHHHNKRTSDQFAEVVELKAAC